MEMLNLAKKTGKNYVNKLNIQFTLSPTKKMVLHLV